MTRKLPLYLLAGILLVSTVGCANPAADAPDAVVEEPAATPSQEAPEATGATVYALSQASTIGFVGAKVTGSHDGGFKAFEGSVSIVDGTPESSSVEVLIDTTSIWADNERLTKHLKSADFFDVESHPTATFESTAIAAQDDGTFTLTGNLDLHGVTKQISFPASIQVDEQGFAASAEFSINRMDFEIVYPGKPDDLIRDEVLIKLDLRSAASEPSPEESTEAQAS